MSYPPARYHGDDGEVSAVFRPAGAAPELVRERPAPGDDGAITWTRTSYLGTSTPTGHPAAAVTDHEFGLYRVELGPRAGGPSTHFHRTISESFYILSGTVQLADGERTIDAEPGDFLYVPVGGLHAFGNVSDEPASMLLLFAPGAPRETYFEEVAQAHQLPDEERDAFFLAHDNHWRTPG